MNKNNKEIELRFKVQDKDKLQSWLSEHAEKSYEKQQIDEYFTPAHRNFFDEEFPFEYLRIRNSGGKFFITYKHWHPGGESEHTHCDEYETEVGDGHLVKKILKSLNFKSLVVVDKFRTAYKYENFEITMDEVRGLGVFCEIEIKGEYASVKAARDAIIAVAKEFGFGEKDRGDFLKLGYAYVIARKKGLIKE